MDIVNDVSTVAWENMDEETLRGEVSKKLRLLPIEDQRRLLAPYIAKQHLRSLIMELTDEECEMVWEMWNAQHS